MKKSQGLNFSELKVLYDENNKLIADLETTETVKMLKERQQDSKRLLAAMALALESLEKKVIKFEIAAH